MTELHFVFTCRELEYEPQISTSLWPNNAFAVCTDFELLFSTMTSLLKVYFPFTNFVPICLQDIYYEEIKYENPHISHRIDNRNNSTHPTNPQ